MKHLLLTLGIILSICVLIWSLWFSMDNKIPKIEKKLTDNRHFDNWNIFVQSLIFIESSGNDNAIGDNGRAIGCLQIHPCVIEDVNEFIGANMYSLNDRLDRRKSLEIFEWYMLRYNPEKSIERAIHLWNPRAGVSYRDKIMKEYNKIKNHDNI